MVELAQKTTCSLLDLLDDSLSLQQHISLRLSNPSPHPTDVQNLVAKKEEVEIQIFFTVDLNSVSHTRFKNQASKVMPGFSYVLC